MPQLLSGPDGEVLLVEDTNLTPRLMLGPDGEIVVDEESLVCKFCNNVM